MCSLGKICLFEFSHEVKLGIGEREFRGGGDVYLLLTMVCSRYHKEFIHYETILKRKSLRKLKHNVWERKTKWILLEKADNHYRMKLLQKHTDLWVTYLYRCYKKKINRQAADALHEEKLKSRGISALKRNVERNLMLTRISRRKFEWNLKYRCWHQWKHYVEKRLKVREVKLLADRIREERLRIRFFYLWLFRFNAKLSLKNAFEAAAARYETKLAEKSFTAWKIFTTKQICKVKIENLITTCYQDKLKEKFLRCWKRYTQQKKRYKYQVQIIKNFYQTYLIKNYLQQWLSTYKQIKFERKICNFNLAVNFHETKLLKKSFQILLKLREVKQTKITKMDEFRETHTKIYLKYYLNLWMEKKAAIIICNRLENKATEWRENYLREIYLLKLLDKYQNIIEEREEIANIITYSNAIITHRAFQGWREVTERKINRKIQLENASKLHSELLMKRVLEKLKKFVERRSKKKMADEYYKFILLSRVMHHWNIYFTEKNTKLSKAKDLEQKHYKRLLKNLFDFWKNETDISKSKQKRAIDFYKKLNLSKMFRNWKKITREKTANKNRYNRNKTSLNNILIKDFIITCYEMLSVKRTLKKKLEELKLKQQRRCLKAHYGTWRKFVNKRKNMRRNVEIYAQLRSDILLEHYVDTFMEMMRSKKVLNGKLEVAKEAEGKILKGRYLKRWLCFVSWKRERILRCFSDDRNFAPKEDLQVFVPVGNSKRRKPMIPDYLKAE